MCPACHRSRHSQAFLFLVQVSVQPPLFPDDDKKRKESWNQYDNVKILLNLLKCKSYKNIKWYTQFCLEQMLASGLLKGTSISVLYHVNSRGWGTFLVANKRFIIQYKIMCYWDQLFPVCWDFVSNAEKPFSVSLVRQLFKLASNHLENHLHSYVTWLT